VSKYVYLAIGTFVVMFIVSIIYAKLKKPDAPTLDKVKIPGGVWIVVAILVAVMAMFVFLLMKNPLER
jgi:tryptophan-rich sensory protein